MISLINCRLKKEAEDYLSTKEKKQFDRFRTPDSFRHSQEIKKGRDTNSLSPISHLPVRKEVSPEVRKVETYSRSPPEAKIDQQKVKKHNELFIAKLVFDALDHVIRKYLLIN